MSGWTGPTFRDALVAALQARPNLTGLTPPLLIAGYVQSIDYPDSDVLTIGVKITDTREYANIGPSAPSDEAVSLQCDLRVVRPGADKTVIDATETRVQLVMDEVALAIRDKTAMSWVTTQANNRRIDTREYFNFPSDAGAAAVRVALVNFTVAYEART